MTDDIRETRGVVYPRFLGQDSNYDFVWELADGRWTWGDSPREAVVRPRTFTPDRYLEKYGPVTAQAPFSSRAIEARPAFPGPAEPVRTGWPYEREGPAPVPVRVSGEDPETTGARQALSRMLQMLDGWIEGARENHDGLGHRNENRGEECWTQFHPADIRSMINDVARELGLAEFPKPEKPKEDEVR
jgi:hypothetical protein